MNFLEKNTRVIVRSRISQKILIRPITDYVNGKLYSSLIEYMELHMREIKRTGFHYSLDDIIEDPYAFELFVNKMVHADYKIKYEEINKPIWIIKSYKKGAPLFLVLNGNNIPHPTLRFLNQVLCTYGHVNKRPKYEAKSIKPSTSNNEKNK